MAHIEKQIIFKALKEPIFAKDVFSQLPTSSFKENETFTELAVIINRYYQTNNVPLDKETLLIIAEERLLKRNAKIEKQEQFYDTIKDLYTIDAYDMNTEVIDNGIQGYIRKTMIQNVLLKEVSNGDLESEDTVNNIINELQKVAIMNIGSRGGSTINFFEDVEKKKEALRGLNQNKFSSGLTHIDNATDGGLARGELGMLNAYTGDGKALVNGSEVKTPQGYTAIEDLEIGSEVIDTEGNAQYVTGVFPQGKCQVYEVTFSDGSTSLCNREHLWTYYVNDVETTTTLGYIMDNELLVDVTTNAYRLQLPRYNPPKVHPLGSIEERSTSFNNLCEKFTLSEETDCYIEFSKLTKENKNYIKELAQSLGYLVSYQSNKKEEEEYTLGISLVDKDRYFSAIETKPYKKDMTCISVNSKNRLFLTNDWIPTHNTMWAVNLVRNYVMNGLNVLFIPLEETESRMILRLEQVFSQQPKQHLLAGGALNESLYDGVQGAYEKLRKVTGKPDGWGELIIDKYYPNTFTPTMLEQAIIDTTLVLNNPVDVIIIDYPDLMNNPHLANNSEVQAGGKLSADIRRVCQEYGAIGWVFSQLNRSGSTKTEVKTASMIEGAKQKMNAIEFIATVNQTEEEIQQGFTRLYIDKARYRDNDLFERMNLFKTNGKTMTISNQTDKEQEDHIALLRSLNIDVTGNKVETKQQYTPGDTQNRVDLINSGL